MTTFSAGAFSDSSGKLIRSKEKTLSIFGEISFKDRPNITRILRLLKKKGFIETRPDESNKKANLLFLTKSGKDMLVKSAPVVSNSWDKRYAGISPEEDRILRKILKHIIGNIEDQLYKS